MDSDQSGIGEISDEDLGDPEGHTDPSSHFGHRDRLGADLEDRGVFELETFVGVRTAALHQRLDAQVHGGMACPTTGDHEGADQCFVRGVIGLIGVRGILTPWRVQWFRSARHQW